MAWRIAIYPAILAAALTGVARAAPMVPLPGASSILPFETVEHPLMLPGAWQEHRRLWDAREGIHSGNANDRLSCMRNRSYDRASHTYRGRGGRRIPCP